MSYRGFLGPDGWQGFRPVGYQLDWAKVRALRLVELRDGSEFVTTAGAIWDEVLPYLFQRPGTAEPRSATQAGWGDLRITTPTREIRIESFGPNAEFFRSLLEVYRAAGDEYTPLFFFFGLDRIAFEESYSEEFDFFVTYGYDIVVELFTLRANSNDDGGSEGFDPSVLRPPEEPENAQWKGWADANLRWWYRKFYTETRTGQLMVLRTDFPPIFHYAPQGRRSAQNAAFWREFPSVLVRSWPGIVASLIIVGLFYGLERLASAAWHLFTR
jgi:hypothetical protein